MSRSRIRSRGGDTHQPTSYLEWCTFAHYPGGPWTKVTAAPTGDLLGTYEWISDVVGSNGNMNPVRHVKYHFSKGGVCKDWIDSNYVRVQPDFPIELTRGLLNNAILPARNNWDIDSGTFGDFCSGAAAAMTEQVPPTFDGLYLVQDLHDAKHLLQGCLRLVSRLKTEVLRAGVLKSGESFAKHSVKSLTRLTKWSADAYLTQLFGVQPLIREVKGFFDVVASLRDRLEFLRRTVGQEYTTHQIHTFVPTWKQTLYYVHGLAPQEWHAFPTKGKVTHHAEIRVKNQLKGLDGALAELNSALASGGVSHAIGFAWDLVPFSFVVDWFIPIQRWLDRYLVIQPFTGSLKAVQGVCSVKLRADWDIYFWPAKTKNAKQYIGALHYEEYQRVPGLRAGFSLFTGGGLSATQQAILASLIVQRV